MIHGHLVANRLLTPDFWALVNVDPGLINPCLLIWGGPTGFSGGVRLLLEGNTPPILIHRGQH